MSRDQTQDESPLSEFSQILDYFRSGEKDVGSRVVGTEHEKFLFNRETLKPLSFDEPHGIEWILKEMAARYDWEPAMDEGRVVALEGPDGAVSLEPGGQFELSGTIRKTLFETDDEITRHFEQLAAVAKPHVIAACWGLNPFDDLDVVPWVPKSRYAVMKRYMETRGGLAHWMMKMTCTIQANFDYTSEDDAAELVRVAVLLSPIVNALFANSGFKQGAPSGFQSYRAQIWTDTDPDRCGVPAFMYRDDWGYEEYAQWVLDVPMFFIRRDNHYVDMSGRSFRHFMDHGYDGHTAQMGDFELHLSTVFPEVRMKKFVEVRSADGGSQMYIAALPALWKGILYDEQARAAVLAKLGTLSATDHAAMFDAARTHGLAELGDLAAWVVKTSDEGLKRIAVRDGHPSESIFLAPLYERLSAGSSADTFRSLFKKLRGDRMALLHSYDSLS